MFNQYCEYPRIEDCVRVVVSKRLDDRGEDRVRRARRDGEQERWGYAGVDDVLGKVDKEELQRKSSVSTRSVKTEKTCRTGIM